MATTKPAPSPTKAKPKKAKPDPLPGEIEWLKSYAIPLLRQLGFVRVDFLHGPGEMGKDLVFAELDRFGLLRYYAAQAKREVITASDGGREFEALVTQLRSAYEYKYKDSSSGREVGISGVYLLTIQRVNEHVKNRLIQRTGTWLHFVDADQLEIAKQLSCWPSPREREAVLRAICFDLTLRFRTHHKELRAAFDAHRLNSRNLAIPSTRYDLHTVRTAWSFLVAELRPAHGATAKGRRELQTLYLLVESAEACNQMLDSLRVGAYSEWASIKPTLDGLELANSRVGEEIDRSVAVINGLLSVGAEVPGTSDPNPDEGSDQPVTPKQ